MRLPDFLTEHENGESRVAGHRVGLLHLVYHYNRGESPDALARRFPTLPLPLVEKLIGYYGAHRAEVDAYVAGCLAEMEGQQAAGRRGPGLEELRRRVRSSV